MKPTSAALGLIAAASLSSGCTEDVTTTSSVTSPGMLNGMLNGFFHTQGLTALLAEECPELQVRLLEEGGLTRPLSPELAEEISAPLCDHFLFYTAQLMLPLGSSLVLTAGGEEVASYEGRMGLQYLVQQVYPTYQFATHAFTPQYPVARKVVTQGYAALTNGITRTVSYKTNIPALDAHRVPAEDAWPRELLQLVPFSPQGLAAMATNSAFLARQPDFFNSCDPLLINYDYLEEPVSTCSDQAVVACEQMDAAFGPITLPVGYCPLPVMVHGNLDFVDDVVPGRSCRIIQDGEVVPPGTSLVGDVLVPAGGCPFIYYAGRDPEQPIYDDRSLNLPEGSSPSSGSGQQPSPPPWPPGPPPPPPGPGPGPEGNASDGCDVSGPSSLSNCDFDVVDSIGAPVPDNFLSYWVFNVEPLAQP